MEFYHYFGSLAITNPNHTWCILKKLQVDAILHQLGGLYSFGDSSIYRLTPPFLSELYIYSDLYPASRRRNRTFTS